MKVELDPLLESVIKRHLKQNYLKKAGPKVSDEFTPKDYIYFSKGVSRLSDYFTKERGDLPKNYFNDPVLRSGYMAYFLPVNYLKFLYLLQQLKGKDIPTGKVRILDLGAGPATASLAALSFYSQLVRSKQLKDAWLDLTLIDQNYAILKDAKQMHDAYLEKLNLTNIKSDIFFKNYDFKRGGLDRLLRGVRFHIIFLGNVLNEFSDRQQQQAFVDELIDGHLDPHGKIIIAEPALKKTSRDVQAVRDNLLAKYSNLEVLAPCTHQEICPLNVVNKRDWCHFYMDYKANAMIDKMDKLVGIRKDFLAASFLLLSADKKRKKTHEHVWRVISNNMKSKGKCEFVLCGARGRYRIEHLVKNKNFTLENIKRGNLIQAEFSGLAEGIEYEGVHRWEDDDQIKILARV